MYDRSFAISLLLLALTIAGAVAVTSRDTPVVVRTNLERIPMQIGDYTATRDSFSPAVYEELNADQHVYRHYRSPDGRVLDLYIGYYGTAKGGRTGHNPYACLPGSGWGIVQDRKILIKNPSKGGRDDIRYVLAAKNHEYMVMLHWYQAAGSKVLGSGLSQNIQRFTGRLLHNRSDGAFVRVSTNVIEHDFDRAREDAVSFAEKILELLPKYWPEESGA